MSDSPEQILARLTDDELRHAASIGITFPGDVGRRQAKALAGPPRDRTSLVRVFAAVLDGFVNDPTPRPSLVPTPRPSLVPTPRPSLVPTPAQRAKRAAYQREYVKRRLLKRAA